LLGVLLIFFRFAHHGGLRPLVRYRTNIASGILVPLIRESASV
jgi:hypothetical protein